MCKQRHGNEHNCQQGTHSQILPAKLAWLAVEAQWYRYFASNDRAATSEAIAAITGNTVALEFLKNTVSLIGGASQHSFPHFVVAACILVVIGRNGKRTSCSETSLEQSHSSKYFLSLSSHSWNSTPNTLNKSGWIFKNGTAVCSERNGTQTWKYEMEHGTLVHEDQILCG